LSDRLVKEERSMFDFARDLKRIFQPGFAAPRDGLADGDPAVLELLSLDLLVREARATDISAGRIGAADRPHRQLRQAGAWREVARRSGDVEALRKAAAAAEAALAGVKASDRTGLLARARREQAACGLLGADLFGNDGLIAAADRVLDEAARSLAPEADLAAARLDRARLKAFQALQRRDLDAALAAAADCDAAVSGLRKIKRVSRRDLAQARLARAEVLFACGRQAKDDHVLEQALAYAEQAALGLDDAYEPLTYVQCAILRAEILSALGDLTGDPSRLINAIELIQIALGDLDRDHSPLDWARAQTALGEALFGLGEATGAYTAYEKARSAYDAALLALRRRPGLIQCGLIAHQRAACIVAAAETFRDLFLLEEAEATFRCELSATTPDLDPVPWAVCQLSLAQLYAARLNLTSRDRGERAKAALAYEAALEVFSERGMVAMADIALNGLEGLRHA